MYDESQEQQQKALRIKTKGLMILHPEERKPDQTQGVQVVSIDLFSVFFMPFSYNGVYYQWSNSLPPPPPPTYIILSAQTTINKGLLGCSSGLRRYSSSQIKRREEEVLGSRQRFAFIYSSCIIVPPKEMLLSFSIGTFLANYDVTNRKQQIDPIYSIVQNEQFESSISQLDKT